MTKTDKTVRTNKNPGMGLNHEIQQLLASFNTPPHVAERIAAMCRQIENDRIAPGIEVGAVAPELELPDSSGARVRLSRRLERGPVVVTFFRGAWCPVCSLQVAALLRALPEIRARGGVLIGVHPDTGQFAAEPLDDGFLLLSDADQSAIRDYKLQFTIPADVQQLYLNEIGLDLSSRNADGSWSLPVPGTFVLDSAGVVRRRHVTADFTQRMEPDEIVAALEEIGSGAPR